MDTKPQIIDAEDAETVLIEIEKSLNLTFQDNELSDISTLGQLCDHISEKIELENVNDCTSQQFFYKIRNSISQLLKINPKSIHPNSRLDEIIPRKNRRQIIKNLNENLGFETNVLMISNPLLIFLSISLVSSFVLCFFYFSFGWISFAIFAVWLKVAFDFRKELKLITVRELVEKCSRENYIKSRRNKNSFNKSEVEKLILNSFNYRFGMKDNLSREAIFK